MGNAKNIILKPISAKVATPFIKRVHYSGKVVQNSNTHIGVYWNNKLEGVMSFGSPLDKRKVLGLVSGTKWNEMIELNRMAFSDVLPRNSESRAIAIAMKLLRKHAPHLKWVLSFADGTQCGDGTIYRASGFVLTSIKTNSQLYKLPYAHELNVVELENFGLTQNAISHIKDWLDSITTNARQDVAHKLTIQDRTPSLEGAPHAHKMSLEGGARPSRLLSEVKKIMRKVTNGGTSADKFFKLIGGEPAIGYQLRYIYFLDKSYRVKLTVPELPFSVISEMGAGMYKGESK